jgi:hypothetical protein
MKKNILILVGLVCFGLVTWGVYKVSAAISNPSTPEPTITPEVFMPLPADQRAFEAVRAALAQQLGVDPLTITLVKAEPVDWTDGCLGLGGPAESCLQVITPGFRVTVQQTDMVFEFHTDLSAEIIRQVK